MELWVQYPYSGSYTLYPDMLNVASRLGNLLKDKGWSCTIEGEAVA